MLAIRRIFDAATEPNRQSLDEVNQILRLRFAGLPTLVVQEGGYLTRTLGANGRSNRPVARAAPNGLRQPLWPSRLDGR